MHVDNINILHVVIVLEIQDSDVVGRLRLPDHIHLDHIKPVNAFNLENYDEFLDCCNYTNCQPLLRKDNLSKNNC